MGTQRGPAERRAELRAHLLAHGIAGDVATAREENLRKYRLFADGDPKHLFGLEPERHWSAEDVLALMALRCGVSPDRTHRQGQDRIDPDRTIEALDRFADRVATAVRRRERVLFGTGHPATLLEVHLRLAEVLRAHGVPLVVPDSEWPYDATNLYGRVRRRVRFIACVGVVEQRGSLEHTHSARPIRGVLQQLATSETPLPELVIGDHGWAGGAAQAGIEAIGFADSNDPALFVGEAEGKVTVSVPLDDGIAPRYYGALLSYVVDQAGL